MELIIKNKSIKGNIENILHRIALESGRPYFRDIQVQGNNLLVTCCHHKNGVERHPSLNIYNYRKDPKIIWGTAHCFSCGYTASLPQLVADCFGKDLSFGEAWLFENYGEDIEDYLPEIKLNNKNTQKVLDESILKGYNNYHPYMWERHLTKEIVDKFKVGYDPISECITFPVWDEHNKLTLITKRSVNSKKFYIDKNGKKPVYLLNYLINNNITTAYIAESQINALTLQKWGYPGVAMLGGGCKEQYEILKKSGVRNYILCFDGDEAGDDDIKNFIRNMPKDVLISIKKMPRDGRDINDLTKEEFDSLEVIYC